MPFLMRTFKKRVDGAISSVTPGHFSYWHNPIHLDEVPLGVF